MSKRGGYVAGDWNAECYVCGRAFRASSMVKSWKGYWTCYADFEPRHPQDFVRAVPDSQGPAWVQVQNLTNFVNICTPNGRSAIPGFAEPGCVIPGFQDPLFDSTLIAIP